MTIDQQTSVQQRTNVDIDIESIIDFANNIHMKDSEKKELMDTLGEFRDELKKMSQINRDCLR